MGFSLPDENRDDGGALCTVAARSGRGLCGLVGFTAA